LFSLEHIVADLLLDDPLAFGLHFLGGDKKRAGLREEGEKGA